jgi:hypothetical protein
MPYLIVEDEEAERLAAELARATGKSIQIVVLEALKEKLDRLPKKQEREASFDELIALADRIAGRAEGSNLPHGKLQFDDHGRPK